MDAAWTLLTARIARPWAGLYAPAASARLDAWAQRGRQRFGAPQIVSRRDGLRGLVRALQQGHAVYLLPDLDTGPRHSVFAPFCGVLAATVTTLPRLAGLADAPVVPVRAYLTRSGYRVQVEPPWPHYPSGDDEADVRAMNAALTRWVMQAPGQYHWLHRRFKTRPPGEPPLY
jgi:KDO2-lipid IV(A) lauroyltransferase